MHVRPSRPIASVVVPAHDESAVVLRCLHALLHDAEEGEFDVVVAANGCSDDTVLVVRSSGLPVRCLDLPATGKVTALNAADAATEVFPRIYLDADVVLDTAAARSLAQVLSSRNAMAAAPGLRMDTSDCSRLVRAYYRVWTRLPVLGEGYVGSGVYGLNAAGHRRVSPFPQVTNDDGYVRRSFASHERRTSPGTFTVFPARSVGALVRRGARTRTGNRELDALTPAAAPATGRRRGAVGGLALARRPSTWPDFAAFCVVTALVRLAAARNLRGAAPAWGRDDSSRVSVAS